MESIVLISALTLVGALFLWALLSSNNKATARAVWVSAIIFVLIPTYGPPRLVAALPSILATILFASALIRHKGAIRSKSGLPLLLAFIAFHAFTQIVTTSALSLGLLTIQAIALSLAAIAVTRLPKSTSSVFFALVTCIPLQTALAILEQLRIIPYIWARSEDATYHDIALRVNELAPFLPGRSTGTFAHPILLGLFCAVTLVLCLAAARSTRNWRYLLLAGLAGCTLVLSGTRSATAAALISLAFAFVFSSGRWRALRITLALSVGLVIVTSSALRSFFTSDSLTGSVSYVHRTQILSSVPRILERDAFDVIFGSGAASIEALFTNGTVTGYSDYMFFDNQYVRLLALSGIIGILLFSALAIRTLLKGTPASRVVLVLVLVMMASFDTLTWGFSSLISVLALTGALTVPTRPAQRNLDETESLARTGSQTAGRPR